MAISDRKIHYKKVKYFIINLVRKILAIFSNLAYSDRIIFQKTTMLHETNNIILKVVFNPIQKIDAYQADLCKLVHDNPGL